MAGSMALQGSPVILINSSLSSLLMYLMGFYSFHESLHHDIAKYLSHLFWAGKGDKQKYHMVKWFDICKPKDQGALGLSHPKG